MLANCVCDIQDPIPDAVACTVRACAPGLTGPSPEQCILCVAGKCKNSTGSAECTNCTTGKYSSVVGAVSDVCQSCSITAYSPEGSSSQDACVCGVGVSQKIYALPTITCTGGCLCPGAPQQSNGEIRSQPGRLNKYTFPTKYKSSLTCIWTIVADRPISLTFSEFSVGDTYGYAYGHRDYLNIYTRTLMSFHSIFVLEILPCRLTFQTLKYTIIQMLCAGLAARLESPSIYAKNVEIYRARTLADADLVTRALIPGHVSLVSQANTSMISAVVLV